MIRRLERSMGVGAATVLVLLMVVVLVDVIGRNLFNRPLASGTEVTEMLMGLLAFLSFPLLAWRQRDITVDLLDMVTGERARKFQVALAGGVGAVVFALLSWQAVLFARRAGLSGESTPQLQIPLAYTWWVMAFLAAMTAVAALIVALAAFTSHPIEPVKPSEID